MNLEQYIVGRGKIYIAALTSEVPAGEERVGNTNGFTMNVEIENLEHYNYESGMDEIDHTAMIGVPRDFDLEIDNMAMEILAWAVVGDLDTVTQAGGAVSAEAVTTVEQGKYYQLGRTMSNPTGNREITSVVVDMDVDDWVASTAYAVGDYVKDTGGGTYVYKCTVAGTSDSSEPSPWGTVIGGTTVDNTVTWTCMAAYPSGGTMTVTTDYTVDTTLARLYIVSGGGIPDGVDLAVDYTKVAVTWDQVASALTNGAEILLHYVSDNPDGANRDVLIPRARIIPSGGLDFLTGKAYQKATFKIKVLKPSTSGVVSMYINGRPVAS